MNYKNLFFIASILFLGACKQKQQLYKIEGHQLKITDSLTLDPDIEQFIKPYREHVNKNLDSVLAYAVDTYSKQDGEFNTAIGNLMADVVYKQANPVFKARSGKDIDFVLLNHGGIRSIISKGHVTSRTAFKMMPFENAIVVVELPGAKIKELLTYLSKAKRAHPISGLKLVLDQDYNITLSTIKGTPIDFNKSYFVATNDYLYNGGDHMDFFKPNDSLYTLDYKIRNALLDYFTKVDTINPTIDDRFIQLKN